MRHVIAGIGHFIQRERPDAVVEADLQLARSKNKLRRIIGIAHIRMQPAAFGAGIRAKTLIGAIIIV